MKNKLKKTAAFVLALTLTAGAVPAAIGGAAIVAKADNETVSDYTLTIPASFDIKNEGWNEIGDISVKGQLADHKKLVVSADSANHWGLKNEEGNIIEYDLKNSAEGELTTSWEFEELSETPAVQTIGVDVEPFKDKPTGEYTDVVTFTASVESVSIPVTAITLNKAETTIYAGLTEMLSVTSVLPDEATDKTYTWSSLNPEKATVDATTGKVTGVAEGTAVIRATANDGSGVYGECTVTVQNPPLIKEKLVNDAQIVVKVGQAWWGEQATITGKYNNGSISNISFTPGDPNSGVYRSNVKMVIDGDNLTVDLKNTTYGSTMTITFNISTNTYTETINNSNEPYGWYGYKSIEVGGTNFTPFVKSE